MLLAITTTYQPATDLGYLLAKHPARVQTFPLPFGKVHVFYSEATETRCTAAMLLDIDPVGLVRREGSFALEQYVNDRPYVASSFLSVAIAQVYGSALGGRCKERPELANTPIPLEATLTALPSRGGEDLLQRLFEPLGYELTVERAPLDPAFPAWGMSNYTTLTLRGMVRLQDLLSHLYVLIPVLDDEKHYYVGDAEVEKLIRHGEGWLKEHPENKVIARRYLRHKQHLTRSAIERLLAEDSVPSDESLDESDLDADVGTTLANEVRTASAVPLPDVLGVIPFDAPVNPTPAPVSPSPTKRVSGGEVNPADPTTVGTGYIPSAAALPDSPADEPLPTDPAAQVRVSIHRQRLESVLAAIKSSGSRRILDLGCGEGLLIRMLLRDPQFTEILGMDVSSRALMLAARKLKLENMPPKLREKLTLLHGSLLYRDARLSGYDAAAVVEVIEHLDPPRLSAFERVLFDFTRPPLIAITTPNAEYNVMWESLPGGQFRHADHRFEWTRAEFAEWANRVAAHYGYTVTITPVGDEVPDVGAASQLAVFTLT